MLDVWFMKGATTQGGGGCNPRQRATAAFHSEGETFPSSGSHTPVLWARLKRRGSPIEFQLHLKITLLSISKAALKLLAIFNLHYGIWSDFPGRVSPNLKTLPRDRRDPPGVCLSYTLSYVTSFLVWKVNLPHQIQYGHLLNQKVQF